MNLFLFRSCIIFLAAQAFPQYVNFTVGINSYQTHISPYIYGPNPEFTANENLNTRRLDRNRMTGYKRENNASSAGTDRNNSSDNYPA